MLVERPSAEVLKDLLNLLVEYQNAVEAENSIKDDRIRMLEHEVYKLKTKNADIARILTRED
jgi:hypothetical protein